MNRIKFSQFWTLVSLVILLTEFTIAQRNNDSPENKKTYKIGLYVTENETGIATNIHKKDINLLVNGKEVSNYTLERLSAPLLYVLAIDNSGSMYFILGSVIKSAKKIIGQNTSADGTLLIRFVDKEIFQIVEKFSSNQKFLNKNLDKFFVQGGKTALIDAIYKSVEIIAGQKGFGDEYRRFVIVVSDGEDRESNRNEAQLFDRLRKAKVPILFIGLTEDLSKRGRKNPKKRAKSFIYDVAQNSGGLAIFPKKTKDISDFAAQIVPLFREQLYIRIELPSKFKNPRFVVKPSKTSQTRNLHFFINNNR